MSFSRSMSDDVNRSPAPESSEARQRITEREAHAVGLRQGTDALRPYETLLEAFFDSSGEIRGIAEVVGDDIRYLAANGPAAALYGLTPEATSEQMMSRLGVPRDAIADAIERVGESRGSGQAQHFEYRREIDGETRRYAMMLVFLGVGDNGLPRFAFDGRDTTSERQAEEALRESEAKYRALLDGAAEGILVGDATSRKFTYANPAICAMLGYAEQELLQLGVDDIHPAEALPRVIAEYVAMVRGDSRMALSLPCRRKDGSVFYADIVSQPVVIAGRVVMVGFFTDITARKEAEEALRRSRDELEAKVKERTAELHALTVKLIGAEDAERERIVNILHEDLQQMLVAMRYELSTLRDISTRAGKPGAVDPVNSILDKAIEVTRSLSVDIRPPGLSDVELGRALAWVADEMGTRFGLAVRLAVSAAAEPTGTALRSFIVDSVRELLFNVAKHAGTQAVEVRVEPDGERIKVEVKDRGRGFDIAQKPPVGLGIFRIRERADHLGGEFRVVSSPRNGTCAMLVLPKS